MLPSARVQSTAVTARRVFLCFAAAHLEKTEGVVVVARQDFVEICHILFYDPFTPQSKFSHEVCSLSKHGYKCLNSDWLTRLVSGVFTEWPQVGGKAGRAPVFGASNRFDR